MASIIQATVGQDGASSSVEVLVSCTNVTPGSAAVMGVGNSGGRTVLSVVSSRIAGVPDAGTVVMTQVPNAAAVNAGQNFGSDWWSNENVTAAVSEWKATLSGSAAVFNREGFFFEIDKAGAALTVRTAATTDNGTGSAGTITGPAITLASAGVAFAMAMTQNAITVNPKTGSNFDVAGKDGEISPSSDAACGAPFTAGTYTPAWTDSGTPAFCSSSFGLAESGGSATLPQSPRPVSPVPMRPGAGGLREGRPFRFDAANPVPATATALAASSVALPLGGSATATNLVQAASSVSVPLAGSAAGTVLAQADSTLTLGLAGSATITLAPYPSAPSYAMVIPMRPGPGGLSVGRPFAFDRANPVPLTATASATSSLALPLGGSATATVTVQAASASVLPLAGASSVTVLVQATSSAALPLGGSATGVIGAATLGISTLPLPLGGAAATTVLVQASSIAALPLAASSTLNPPMIEAPLYLDFTDLSTRIVFLSATGEEIMGPLKLFEGEVVDVPMVLRGAGGVPQSVAGATSITWTVFMPGEEPIVDEATLEVVSAPDGSVAYPADAELTAVAGKYRSIAEVTYPGSPAIVRKFPGDVVIYDAVT